MRFLISTLSASNYQHQLTCDLEYFSETFLGEREKISMCNIYFNSSFSHETIFVYNFQHPKRLFTNEDEYRLCRSVEVFDWFSAILILFMSSKNVNDFFSNKKSTFYYSLLTLSSYTKEFVIKNKFSKFFANSKNRKETKKELFH